MATSQNKSKDLKTIFVVALVGGAMAFKLYASNRIHSDQPVLPVTGPLAPYAVSGDAATAFACHEASCTYATVQAKSTQVFSQYQAKLLLPAVEKLNTPPGKILRISRAFSFDWYTYWKSPQEASSYILAHMADVGSIDTSGETDQAFKVSNPGYVVSATVAGNSKTVAYQIALNGKVNKAGLESCSYAGPLGQEQLRLDNPAYSGIEFQAVPPVLRLQISHTGVLKIQNGDVLALQFSAPASSSSLSQLPGRAIKQYPAQIEKVTAGSTTGSTLVEARLTGNDAMSIIRDRVILEQQTGETAFPENLWLQISQNFERANGQLLEVPNTAIQTGDEHTQIWINLAGMAVPINVDVLSTGKENSVIAEKPGARGLPIHQEFWRAMSETERKAIMNLLAQQGTPMTGKLLNNKSEIILQADQHLKPGKSIRNGNGTGN
ncbi:hypothetical protein ACO0LD_02335 [Undibacterium sp. Ji83W]|uniref:hypothetical protein n=1 Tax=Undibacterium sp. Ji83W TaxID=3413043 RepID=UPI003BF2B6E3